MMLNSPTPPGERNAASATFVSITAANTEIGRMPPRVAERASMPIHR